jgi:hypothetical protein
MGFKYNRYKYLPAFSENFSIHPTTIRLDISCFYGANLHGRWLSCNITSSAGIFVAINRVNCGHMTVMGEDVRAALAGDFGAQN